MVWFASSTANAEQFLLNNLGATIVSLIACELVGLLLVLICLVRAVRVTRKLADIQAELKVLRVEFGRKTVLEIASRTRVKETAGRAQTEPG